MRLLNFAADLERPMEQFFKLHPMLQGVFMFAAAVLYAKFGKTFLITSMIRNGDDGVHEYLRGIDVDICQNPKGVYEGGVLPAEALVVTSIINRVFRYNPDSNHKVAVYGDIDKKGKHWNHIHFQVCWGNMTLAKFFKIPLDII